MINQSKKIKILVISGGGIYGLIPCYFLKEINKDDLNKVDVIAGTSVGGILALYLSSKQNPSNLFFNFKNSIPKIFKTSIWRKINPFLPKYSGENMDEVKKLILDLDKINLDIVTIGQYIQPSKKHLKVEKYYTLEEYKEIEEFILNNTKILPIVAPLARSSYKAHEAYMKIIQS
jgi:predicted acylesterase/phospholipase RssA